jgi:hypothetical protein
VPELLYLRSRRRLPLELALLALIACLAAPAAPPHSAVLLPDSRKLLERNTFLDNRDWDWYRQNIPIFDSPDADIDATYYYRWELITKHLVYGSPETGYTFTEFMDRPGWSGTYGAISCAAGHHLNEVRWLKDPRYAQDYARYWFDTPGAEPRRYSTWLADAVWELYEVQGDRKFTLGLRGKLAENYTGWEREHFVPEIGMFWQTGMADGMETNINSRQTQDWFAGAPGYRPTLNSYMYADALALQQIAALDGDAAEAESYGKRAANLKRRVQEMLWDPRRQFFLHMFKNDERDGIKALTRTYETGKYAGNEHGREEIGFVPWEFNLPDAGYEAAWKFLMDPNYFYSDFGPTVTERHDPLFLISRNCCVWSGQSWPYATTQTLLAMSNLLHNYRQSYIDKRDYFKLLKVYTLTQRKQGHPYIAESAQPDTGSWEGSDTFDHSEHYFHSGYNDLIITGLAGLRPRADDILEVAPLAPDSWDYFALDDVAYHGHSVSILWDRDGSRYGRGRGLSLFVDGRRVANAPTMERIRVALPHAEQATPQERKINYAVNNDGSFYPRMTASYTDAKAPLNQVNDGNVWYAPSPPNRWTCQGSGHALDWCAVDFGIPRPIDTVLLYVLDDGGEIQAPAKIDLQYWDGSAWRTVPGQRRNHPVPTGHTANRIAFPEIRASKLRALLTHRKGVYSGLSEFEAWGRGSLPLPPPTAPIGNLAYNPKGVGYPKASASYTSPFDRVEEVNDGKSFFSVNSRNRWTAYQSPNATDWVAIDFGPEQTVDTLLLHLWGDGGGVRAPASYNIQYWTGTAWQDAEDQRKSPEAPTTGAVNTVRIKPVRTSRVRVVFTHPKGAYSGMTELEVWHEGSLHSP